jgi:hypothetical protein
LADGFADHVRDFLAADKFAVRSYRWRPKGNQEWMHARIRLLVPSGKLSTRCQLALTAHRFRKPRKYSFSLLYCGECVLRLDVDPQRTHTNPVTLEVVRCTHWQEWPGETAEPDDRPLCYLDWFREFLKRAHIKYKWRLVPPPEHVVQLEFPYGRDDSARG